MISLGENHLRHAITEYVRLPEVVDIVLEQDGMYRV